MIGLMIETEMQALEVLDKGKDIVFSAKRI